MKNLINTLCVFFCLYIVSFAQDNWFAKYNNLQDKSPSELYYLRNEIYARYGKIFRTDSINDHFKKEEWYKPNPSYTDKLIPQNELQMALKIKDMEDDLAPFIEGINEGRIHLEYSELFNKAFNEAKIKVQIKAFARGSVGEYLGNINFLFPGNHVYKFSINRFAICDSFNGEIKLVQLSSAVFGFEVIFPSEMPQEGDWASPHVKTTSYMLYTKYADSMKLAVDTTIYFESTPYLNDIDHPDYKHVTKRASSVSYIDMNNDNVKDVVFTDKKTHAQTVKYISP